MMDKNELSKDLPPGAKSVAPPPAPAAKPNRFAVIVRRILFALLGAVLIFLAGALAAYLLIARPAQSELSAVSTELEAQKSAAQQVSADLDSAQQRLAALEAEKKDLQARLASADLYIAILNALTEAQTARIEIAARNTTGASLALSNLGRALKTLESVAQSDQKAVIAALQKDLQPIVSQLASNPSAAQSELEKLAGNLMQLKAAYLNLK